MNGTGFSVKDSMTDDSDLHILCVKQPQKPDNTVDTRYVLIRRDSFILYTIRKKDTRKFSSMKIQIVGH